MDAARIALLYIDWFELLPLFSCMPVARDAFNM